jgi:hypothetical protein
MTISKPERYELEIKIFEVRGEIGIQAIRDWLFTEQMRLNGRWPSLLDEELTQAQGAAALIQRLIKLIDVGPTMKTEGGA